MSHYFEIHLKVIILPTPLKSGSCAENSAEFLRKISISCNGKIKSSSQNSDKSVESFILLRLSQKNETIRLDSVGVRDKGSKGSLPQDRWAGLATCSQGPDQSDPLITMGSTNGEYKCAMEIYVEV